MKTTSWDQTKTILHSIGTVINQGDITTKNYVNTKTSETKEYVDNKIIEFVGNTPVADQIAKAKSNIPESSNSFETLVTNQDGEMKWEERTHYKSIDHVELIMDEENEYNIVNENGDVVLYHADGASFWPDRYDEFYVEFPSWYDGDCKGFFKTIEHNGNLELSSSYNESIYIIDNIEEDSVTINGYTFTTYGIYAPSFIEVPNENDELQDVELNELICVEYQKLDEAFIPPTIARKKDILTPVQSDWNTNDESDLSYIKNRTHYEVEKTIELLPITTVASDAQSRIADFTEDWNNDQFVALGNSKIYTTFDGKTYTYDSGLDYLETNGSSTTIMLGGNPHLFSNYLADNGLPFFVGLMPISRRFIAKWPQDGNEHTFSIKYGSGEYDVHQLNPKFIPTASEEQLIQLLIDIDALPAMTDNNGAIFTHKDSILLI